MKPTIKLVWRKLEHLMFELAKKTKAFGLHSNKNWCNFGPKPQNITKNLDAKEYVDATEGWQTWSTNHLQILRCLCLDPKLGSKLTYLHSFIIKDKRCFKMVTIWTFCLNIPPSKTKCMGCDIVPPLLQMRLGCNFLFQLLKCFWGRVPRSHQQNPWD